ncbi:MAG: host attachment protein [Steroidobacter sp.]
MIAIVVADQQRACIYLADAAGKPMKQVAAFINPDARLHEHELGSARPGRVVSAAGHMYHSFSGHLDFRHQATLQFIRVINQALLELFDRHQCDAVVLVADGRMMGLLRRKLDRAVQSRVAGEISRNWTRRSPRLLQALMKSRSGLFRERSTARMS